MTSPIRLTTRGKYLLLAAWLPLGLCARTAFAQDETPGATVADPAAAAAEGTIPPAGAAGTESPTAAPADASPVAAADASADATAGASTNGAVEPKSEIAHPPQTYEYIETVEFQDARYRYRMHANCLVHVAITGNRDSGEEISIA